MNTTSVSTGAPGKHQSPRTTCLWTYLFVYVIYHFHGLQPEPPDNEVIWVGPPNILTTEVSKRIIHTYRSLSLTTGDYNTTSDTFKTLISFVSIKQSFAFRLYELKPLVEVVYI